MVSKNGPQKARYYRQFKENGYFAHVTNNNISSIWMGEERYDFGELDRNISEILKADKEALVVVEFHANAPEWWEKKHPDQLQFSLDGATYGQSLASRLWRKECGECIKECVRFAEEKYGDHMLGYFVGAGHTWEWFYRTTRRYGVDYSEPMRDAFEEWTRKKYHDDVELLRKSWKNEEASFETVVAPTKQEELKTDILSFRDPSKGMKIIDFYEFYSENVVEAILGFAKTVKEATENRKLFGVFYGHILDWISNCATAQHSGHLAMGKIIDSPHIDIFAGPNSYIDRSIGSEAFPISAPDSFKVNNKLWLSENDTRTHKADSVQDFCGRPETLKDSIVLLKRDFSSALLRGMDMVWFSLFKGWFDDKKIMSLFGQMRKIADKAIMMDRQSAAEIAVIVDETSPWYQGLSGTYSVDPFISKEPRACDLFPRMGTPYDMYLLTDLKHEQTHKYKMYIFINAFHISGEYRKIIKEKLQKDDKMLVWMYAPGFVDENLSTQNMEEVTGMTFGCDEVESDLFVRIHNFDTPLTDGDLNFGNILPTWIFMDFDACFGVGKPIGPIFHCSDEGAIHLGSYTCNKKTGFAVKKLDGWTSVFAGTPFIPPLLLRKMARMSEVHIYNDMDDVTFEEDEEMKKAGWTATHVYNYSDDILYANKNFLCLHTKHAGKRRLRLPATTDVYDVFAEQLVAKETKEFTLMYPERETTLYYIGKKPWDMLEAMPLSS